MKGVFKLSTFTLLIILSVIIVAFCQDEYDDIDEKPTPQFSEKIIIMSYWFIIVSLSGKPREAMVLCP